MFGKLFLRLSIIGLCSCFLSLGSLCSESYDERIAHNKEVISIIREKDLSYLVAWKIKYKHGYLEIKSPEKLVLDLISDKCCFALGNKLEWACLFMPRVKDESVKKFFFENLKLNFVGDKAALLRLLIQFIPDLIVADCPEHMAIFLNLFSPLENLSVDGKNVIHYLVEFDKPEIILGILHYYIAKKKYYMGWVISLKEDINNESPVDLAIRLNRQNIISMFNETLGINYSDNKSAGILQEIVTCLKNKFSKMNMNLSDVISTKFDK
ncbi:MAG: hypothetical protein UR26_C0001G0197 [candidate division TM6 bacterium GW2011_GWF2_32_72]|nr:MAG: hypothetical protein UR26_C0001G0197 [candidate division TM6 bacterium GW2011_GWF2_32_72]